jgi:hypothetical protein
MNAVAEHLHPDLRSTLTLPVEERVKLIRQGSWINYPRATQVLTKLDDLMHQPRTHRMLNMLLVGASGNGKTTLIERFKSLHPVHSTEEGDTRIPVIAMDMPSEPSETRFWSALLNALKIAHRETDPVQRKQNQAVEVLAYVQAKVLVIDEIHNLLHGTALKQRHFLAVMKNLSNQLRLPIVCAGVREAIRALHTDTQLSSRFEAVGLKRWKLDKEFLRLLASFESLTPLAERSRLATPEFAPRIHSLSEGTIGGVAELIKRSAVHALRNGREKIEPGDFDEIDWVRLQDYGRQAEAL